MKKLVLAVLATAVLVGCKTSPTGRTQIALYSDQQMSEMGTASFADMKKSQPINKDAKTNAYVNCIAEKVVAVLPKEYASQNWEVVVFEDESANAFALPGGYIGVHTGLLKIATNQWNRNVQKADTKDNYFTQQANLNGLFSIGKTKHNFLFGTDVENYKTYSTRYNNQSYDTVNIFEEYNPATEGAIPTITKNRLTTTPISRFGIYVQDLVSLTEKWKVLAGVRYSYQDTENNVLTYSNNTTKVTNNYDEAFSPRVGLIFQPTKNHTVFATYSNSFDVNTGADINNEPLKPSIIDQYEVGVKNKFFNDKVQANVTVYQINNNNLAQTSLVDPNFKELAGSIRSEGVEIDITAKPIKGLLVIAGYSFNETKYVKSNTYIEGSLLRYNPKNTANLSFNYEFQSGVVKGLNVGLINSYFGERYAGRSTQVTTANDTRRLIYLSDYFQSDAALGYTFKKISIRAKLSNLFNELNYNAHDDNSLNPIAPRNYSVALSYQF